MPIDIEIVPSPNYSDRKGYDVVGSVIHGTGDGPQWNPVRWMTMSESGVSAQCCIERDGDIIRLVRFNKCAWHAEPAEWLYKGEMDSDVNEYTIGIELSNASLLTRKGDDFYWTQGRRLLPYTGLDPVEATLVYDDGQKIHGWWEPYTNAQLDALQELLLHLARIGYKKAAGNLVGHEEVGMPLGRKKDPGPLFPWDRFNRKTSRRTKGVLAA